MNRIVQKVYDLALPLAAEQGIEIWDVTYTKEAGEWFLRVYIDKPEGIGIADCENFSRAFDPILDEADPIEGSYTFEVSSAGAERELKRPEHFERFLGSAAEVKLYQAADGSKTWTGTLTGYDAETGAVTVETAGTARTFEKAAVAHVRVKLF